MLRPFFKLHNKFKTKQMNKELKKAIMVYMIDNIDLFQLVNNTVKEFRQYIYTEKGQYCIGGDKVHEFICAVNKLIR